jgi:hypothetical protein
MMSYEFIADRDERFPGSPFLQCAKKEGFGLWAIYNSYYILQAMARIDENYFEMATVLAKEFPQSVEPLYKILREGMHEDAKNHVNILYAITNVTAQVTARPEKNLASSPYSDFLIEVSSAEESE